MRLKWVGTWSRRDKKLRVLRLTWMRGKVGDGFGYSAKLSLGLLPRLFSVSKHPTSDDWQLTLLGVQVHYNLSYGGIHV